jgi:hypothetical protein
VAAKRQAAKKAGTRARGVLDLPKAVEERLAEGRAEREAVPLEDLGEWAVPDDRPDPVGVLQEQNATRVRELVPIRHGRMIVSPFTFYRGGAAVMAWDLSRTPATGLRVQCCGDAHLSNFGVFAAPDRRLVFDLNDFDETLPAPFEWDVKRLVASFVVAARDNGHRPKKQRAAARAAAAAYRTTIATAMRFLAVEVRAANRRRLPDRQQPPVVVRPGRRRQGDAEGRAEEGPCCVVPANSQSRSSCSTVGRRPRSPTAIASPRVPGPPAG